MCKETGKYPSIGKIKPHDNGSHSDRHSDNMYDFEVEEISSLDSIDKASVELPNTEDTKEEDAKVQQCCVCLENIGPDIYSTNECDHSACRDCMHEYLNGTTSDPRYENYEHIFCPGLNCDAQFITGELLPKVFTEKDGEESWWSRALTRVFMQNSVNIYTIALFISVV
jgi:hypothetical protein